MAQKESPLTGDAAETIHNSPGFGISAPGQPSNIQERGILVYENGPLVNSPGTGPGGADESLLQDSTLAMGTFGFAHASSGLFRVADDFTVPAGGWNIDSITFYAYQTGSTTTSTITSLNLQIWNGQPGLMGSSVVWGDTTTNVLSATTWSGIFRGLLSAPGATNRPIMANTATVGTFLPAGTYWLDWRCGGSLGSGPWAPPITINGQTSTGNAIQFDGSVWTALSDVGPQGLPFAIETAFSVPTLSQWGLYGFIALLAVGGLAYIRRTRLA